MTQRLLRPLLIIGVLLFSSVQAEPLIIGDTFQVDSKILHEKRRINVYMPPGYAESATLRVPVLYMPDGGIGEDFLHIAGLVQVSVSNGTMRPFLLVGIENTERRRDLTGPTKNEQDRKIAPRVGGSAPFRRFIRDELMPQVAARYRTTDETAIIGESLAGLFVIETLMIEPQLFDTYIAIDPSLWWNDQQLINEADARLGSLAKPGATLYFSSSGEAQLAETANRLAEILTRHPPANLRWHYERSPEEKHSTIYHPAALRSFRKLFGPEETH